MFFGIFAKFFPFLPHATGFIASLKLLFKLFKSPETKQRSYHPETQDLWWHHTRWAPTSYKWSYNPINRLSSWGPNLYGVITPFITSGGLPCCLSWKLSISQFHWCQKRPDTSQPPGARYKRAWVTGETVALPMWRNYSDYGDDGAVAFILYEDDGGCDRVSTGNGPPTLTRKTHLLSEKQSALSLRLAALTQLPVMKFFKKNANKLLLKNGFPSLVLQKQLVSSTSTVGHIPSKVTSSPHQVTLETLLSSSMTQKLKQYDISMPKST